MKKDITRQLKEALSRWEDCKPPYSNNVLKMCVTSAKIILASNGKARRTKYEQASYLRIDFSKAGKVTFYTNYPKKMQLKNCKLGDWPNILIEEAREKAASIAEQGLSSESVHFVIDDYAKDLLAKVKRGRLSENTYHTYRCRLKNIKENFSTREIFLSVDYKRLVDCLNDWIANKSANHANELFYELRRVWSYGAPLYAGGVNYAAMIADDYVSSRVEMVVPTRRYADMDAIAYLWLKSADFSSIQQKNAIRYMILTGVRPINVHNLKWSYVDLATNIITYPAGVNGLRGAMKTQKEFSLPITAALKIILEEQLTWKNDAFFCNQEYVFLQPRDPNKAFSKRSLDKLVKDNTPAELIKGVIHETTVKGRKGAFNTMCRKFLKSNIIVQLRARGYSRSDVREISKLCLHHSDKSSDKMAEHYDFSEEILQEEMELKRLAFEAHEQSILSKAILLKKTLRQKAD